MSHFLSNRRRERSYAVRSNFLRSGWKTGKCVVKYMVDDGLLFALILEYSFIIFGVSLS